MNSPIPVRPDTVEGRFVMTPGCAREELWAGETEKGTDALLVFVGGAPGASKFRADLDEARLLDENTERKSCFNRFFSDRPLSGGVDMSMVGGKPQTTTIIHDQSHEI